VSIRGEGTRRDYDVVLKNGTKVELKNWTTWDPDPVAKLGNQFVRDVILGKNDPSVFKSHRYIFRDPAPRTVEQVKSYLRTELDRHLRLEVDAKRLTQDQAAEVLKAFDAATDLVLVSPARRSGAPPQPPPPPTPRIPAAPPVPEEDDRKRLEQLRLPPAKPTEEQAPVGVE
jgi:hypothetical protein